MTYNIEIKKSVIKSLKKVPKPDQIRIAKSIKSLSKNPRPSNCVKLIGGEYYRIRCGDYRIIYDIQDNVLVVVVLKVGHRRDVYEER